MTAAFGTLLLVVLVVLFVIHHDREHGAFLRRVFLGALAARVAVALGIYVFNGQQFFGADATTYDIIGNRLHESWAGIDEIDPWMANRLSLGSSGWGMYYFVAGVYSVTSRNPLAIQLLNAAIGSLAPVLIYNIAQGVYQNGLVAQRAALLTAFFPSLILWSSQGLKDPLILVAICTVVFAWTTLRAETKTWAVVLMVVGFFVLFALRFYVFYIMAAAVGASALVTSGSDIQALLRKLTVLGVAALPLFYFGIGDQAELHYEMLDLEKLQQSREYLATAATSGFGGDIDIRTEGGLAYALTVGMAYLILAPFPWELTNLRQAITLPEMLVWWALLPMVVSGIRYSLRHRLGDSSTVLVFTAGLLAGFSLYLGNVGTAYRLRAQVLVFGLLFGAVGLTLRTVKKRIAAEGGETRTDPRGLPAT